MAVTLPTLPLAVTLLTFLNADQTGWGVKHVVEPLGLIFVCPKSYDGEGAQDRLGLQQG